MPNLSILNNPFIQDSLTHLRDKNTSLEKFRRYSDRISILLTIDSLKDLSTKKIEIETPLKTTMGEMLEEEVVVIPVLRAGIAMLGATLNLLPNAHVGFVGMERDENTAIASKYYWKVPEITAKSIVLIIDPMLATGGSISYILQHVVPKKPKAIKIISVIAAPEGVEVINKDFPEVKIYTGALDNNLNGKKYIVPGLGDYGDRYFGTN